MYQIGEYLDARNVGIVSQVNRALERYVAAFLDLQRLQAVAPKWPDLSLEIRVVAALALKESRRTHISSVFPTDYLVHSVKMHPYESMTLSALKLHANGKIGDVKSVERLSKMCHAGFQGSRHSNRITICSSGSL